MQAEILCLELTLVCNLRCKHCGSHAGAKRKNELTLAECWRVADDLASLGCEKVTLGGGEPTLHPQWWQIGKRLVDRGVRVNIVSNGWDWTSETVADAVRGGLSNVAFSLDGLRAAHDAVRREGSFDRVIAAIAACSEGGMPVSVVTHINQLNRRELPELRAFLADQNVASWQLQLGNPSGVMADYRDLIIDPADLLWLVPEIAEMRTDDVARPMIYPADNLGYYGKYERQLRDRGARVDFWIGCRAGIQVVGIESDGTVKGCLSLPSSLHCSDRFVEGNLRDEPLPSIWQRSDAFAFNRSFDEGQLAGFCAACRYRDICRGGCAWTAYSHTASRFDNPYCFYRQAVTHGRLDLLGDETPTDAELAAVGRAD